MGKKKGKKNKNNSKNNENSINNNNNIPNNEDEDKDTGGKNTELKIDSKVLIDIINSNNSSKIYDLTTFLSNYNYDILCQEEDKREKEIFVITSINFLIPYLNLYLSQNLNEYEKQIKYNIISSIINIFSNFSENSKYEINFKYIYNKILSEIFYQSFSSFVNELKTNNITDMIKYKTMLILFDLFQLYIDIIKNDDKINSSKGLINYDIIINVLIKEYLFNNDIDNEIKNRAQFLLFSLTTNFYIEINDKNSTKILLNISLNLFLSFIIKLLLLLFLSVIKIFFPLFNIKDLFIFLLIILFLIILFAFFSLFIVENKLLLLLESLLLLKLNFLE